MLYFYLGAYPFLAWPCNARAQTHFINNARYLKDWHWFKEYFNENSFTTEKCL